MTIFKEIEARLENLFEGFFNSKFRSSLQPVELARKLANEMDRNRQISVSQTYSPNIFKVDLSPEDYQQFEGYHDSLLSELGDYLAAHAADKNYRLTGPVRISLKPNPKLRDGNCRIRGTFEENAPADFQGTQLIPIEEIEKLAAAGPSAYLENPETRETYPLGPQPMTIGRKPDNHIVLSDQSVSRHHASLRFDGTAFRLTDLGSTNGTFVNSNPIRETALADNDRLTFGSVDLTFRLSG
jgi:hypothetical protein